MGPLIRIRQVHWNQFVANLLGLEGKWCWRVIAVLFLHFREIDTVLVDSGWSPGLHASGFKSEPLKVFGNSVGGLLSEPPPTPVAQTCVHDAAEKRASAKDQIPAQDFPLRSSQ